MDPISGIRSPKLSVAQPRFSLSSAPTAHSSSLLIHMSRVPHDTRPGTVVNDYNTALSRSSSPWANFSIEPGDAGNQRRLIGTYTVSGPLAKQLIAYRNALETTGQLGDTAKEQIWRGVKLDLAQDSIDAANHTGSLSRSAGTRLRTIA